ncbi:hypothetical protein Tcan_03054 [Toxocara canis]|uniref:Uncharacterized protein n=1 Tax=Toxocara canis TaxID=6265 RepID=A0A0B2VK78_TOXCA|nr:hypothetical protein Tcan_03054 [Toxocara canis]
MDPKIVLEEEECEVYIVTGKKNFSKRRNRRIVRRDHQAKSMDVRRDHQAKSVDVRRHWRAKPMDRRARSSGEIDASSGKIAERNRWIVRRDRLAKSADRYARLLS